MKAGQKKMHNFDTCRDMSGQRLRLRHMNAEKRLENWKAEEEERRQRKRRAAYTKDFTSKDVTKWQIAVATYLIDKLALRAGNEKHWKEQTGFGKE